MKTARLKRAAFGRAVLRCCSDFAHLCVRSDFRQRIVVVHKLPGIRPDFLDERRCVSAYWQEDEEVTFPQ